MLGCDEMLFGKKKKKTPHIFLYNAADALMTECDLRDFALPEETVLALSVEYFNDPEPCEIHRGAVHKRAMMELAELSGGKKVPLHVLSEKQRGYFSEDCASFCVAEDEA
jgi:hypothetical protein